MNLSALPAPLRTLVDAPQDWMEDGQEVNGELTLRSDGTTLGPGRKKGTWSPYSSTGPLIVEATIGGVEHTIRYDVPTEKAGFITGIVLEPAREPYSRCRAQKEYVPPERGANGAVLSEFVRKAQSLDLPEGVKSTARKWICIFQPGGFTDGCRGKAVAIAAKFASSLHVRDVSEPREKYVHLKPGVTWPLERIAAGCSFSSTVAGEACAGDLLASTWQGTAVEHMHVPVAVKHHFSTDGCLYHAACNHGGMHLVDGGHEPSATWTYQPQDPKPEVEVWLGFNDLAALKGTSLADEDPEVTVGIYQPPNKDLAAKRMRAKQAFDHVTGDQLPLNMGFDRTSRVFGSGITFYWVLLRDYAVCMLCFTVASFWYYHMIRTANEENNTTTERLPGLSRVSLGALLMWGSQQAQAGRKFDDEDRDGTLAIAVLDTLMMFALSALALYHYFQKRRARDEADLHAITMDDYSIVVEDLPEDVTEDRLRKHFEKFGVVNEIVMGYDLREMMALRRKLLEQEGNHEMLEYMLKRANEMLGIESDYHKERWVKVFEHKAGEGVTLDLGPSAINDMFERTKIWRFDFAGQPRAYYARHGAITNDFDAYANMLKTWSTRDNVPVEDFDVYGSEADLKNAQNPWMEHNADAGGVGFPRDSGASGREVGMWACLPDSPEYQANNRGDTSFAFYLPSSPVLFGEPEKYKPPPPKYSLTAFASAVTPTKSMFYSNGTFSARSPEVMKALFKTKAQRKEEAVSRIQRNYRAYLRRKVAAEEEAKKQFEAKKLSMSQRAASMAKRAKDAAKTTAVSAVKNTAGKAAGKVADKASAAKVGILKRFRPDDFNPDKLRERIAKSLADIKETKATIEERVKEGYKVVKAWVVFEDEQSRFDCMELVVKSEAEAKSKKHAGSEDDVCIFEGRRIDPNAARAPSDTMWENLGYSKKYAGVRTCRSLFVLFAYLVLNVLTVAFVQSQLRNLPPEAICEEIENGLVDNLHCSKIWNVESTDPVVRNLARRGLQSMQRPLVSYNQCDDYMDFKLFTGNATAYYGYYSGSHPLAPTPEALEAAIAKQEKNKVQSSPTGFDSTTIVDECAAAVCMTCYCSEHSEEAGNESFCRKYSMDNITRIALGAFATIIAAVLNVLVKTLSIFLSEIEHHHSYTDFEKSVTWKIVIVMLLIMVLLPLFMAANIPDISSLGFLFNGEHKDFSGWWYSEFATKFQQVAFINAFSLPFSMASKVIVFELKRRLLAGTASTQRQLDELYKPPPYLLSERYGMFVSAVLYTLLFSAGMPLLYFIMILMCGMLTVIDRVVLLRFCARPPRYTGKLAAMLVHAVPVGIIVHLFVAVYMYGERDLPSYTHMGGETGKWGPDGDDGSGVKVTDHQFDVGERIARLNGFIPFVGVIVCGTSFVIAYAALFYAKFKQKGEGDDNIDEDLPPITQVKKAKQLTGLKTYSITAHPEYQTLFPPGNLVSKGL